MNEATIATETVKRELRKLRRSQWSNVRLSAWIKGFRRGLELSGTLSPAIQQILDKKLEEFGLIPL